MDNQIILKKIIMLAVLFWFYYHSLCIRYSTFFGVSLCTVKSKPLWTRFYADISENIHHIQNIHHQFYALS